MKNILLALPLFLMLIATACHKEEDNTLVLQAHDRDQMMILLHQMLTYMDTVEMTNDPEIDFVRMMIVHHQGAIDMANLELQQGASDSLKSVAQKITDEQQAEIDTFNNYISTHSPGDNYSTEFDSLQMNNMTEMSKVADVQLITGDIDNDFASLMIVHHEGAINNAQLYLQYGNDPWLISKANNIINAQKSEIIELSDWLIANRRR